MKVRSFLLTVLAASIALTACDKSENPGGPTDKTPKSVKITLPNINQASGVRATGEPMSASQAALKNFKVFFLDASGAEVAGAVPSYGTPAEPQQVYFDGENDEAWQGEVGTAGRTITYHFIKPEVAQVVVVGNLGDVEYSEVNKTYAVLNDGDAGINTDDGNHPLYPLYGQSNLTPKDGTDDGTHNNVYTATVTLAPRIARFEIYGFSYTKEADKTYSFDNIKLSKIALNNYYTDYNLSTGAAVNAAATCPTTSTDIWDWIVGTSEPWANELTTTVGQDKKVYLNGTEIPAEDAKGNNATSVVSYGLTAGCTPELLLAFYGVKDGQSDTPLYLRGKFTSTTFEAGKIYRVHFPVKEGKWTQPERCVELTVKVLNWEIVAVEPTF